ncbi:OmpP1/FadL family transporter [Phaeobacter italicus]|jgi:long-subunit fatty acid transport protein|uniref:Outer membrane protein transport protein (OMPP1/FadL/TodX) n=1 Tax=Phaeobacter italicus TaxID=481446 RepID=A0A0H5D3F4_9RHOB|nr:outer membrane protein transport protein [Phaeobacter italicus]EEB71255.1 membrane protein involved in aromatic hydrocarbon degradation [Ruegeria sp. R11]MEC8016217.1 outer membrane protein transport protein [Pseudomonadota bacterium]NKX42441.1 aromatic hydrocarbon degradation protein [Rhodobacteraceae bacterium R_SAG2]MBO9440791.1 aromatic hydrocarbon degradation protein [Phaeobacter italicus]MBY6042756.1 aromatic hydrocarbon degradation protein [Phaeobacter italicus]
MKRYLATSAALALVSAGTAMASGLDRTGQPIGIIFEEGNYAEFSVATTSVDLSGNDRATSTAGTTLNPFRSATGDVGDRFNMFGAGYKRDLNEQLSFALIFDQPWGVDVNYPVGSSALLGGTTAVADSNSLTALLRYKFNDNFSVHGGIRYQEIDGAINLAGGAYSSIGSQYNVRVNKDGAFGWVAGVAYEIPEIALRAALTYSSEIEHDFSLTETFATGASVGTSTKTKTPQSVNLDLQTGIAEDTLLFGGIRWAEHSVTDLVVPGLSTQASRSIDLIDLDDSVTYTLGVGRKFNENWSASIAVIYADVDGDNLVSPLAPTHGYEAIRLGVQYTQDKMKISAGIRYTRLGDAIAAPGGVGVADFSDNDAVSFGVKVGYSF